MFGVVCLQFMARVTTDGVSARKVICVPGESIKRCLTRVRQKLWEDWVCADLKDFALVKAPSCCRLSQFVEYGELVEVRLPQQAKHPRIVFEAYTRQIMYR